MELNERIQLGNIVEKLHAMKSMNMSDDEINNSFSKAEKDLLMKATNDEIEKGGKRAVIGETRIFGGKKCIKTADGWKYVGEGKGAKAQEHVAKNTPKEEESDLDQSIVDYFKEQPAGVEFKDILSDLEHNTKSKISSELVSRYRQIFDKEQQLGKKPKEDLKDIDTPIAQMLRDSKKETEKKESLGKIISDKKYDETYKNLEDKYGKPTNAHTSSSSNYIFHGEDADYELSTSRGGGNYLTKKPKESSTKDTVKPASTEPEKKESNPLESEMKELKIKEKTVADVLGKLYEEADSAPSEGALRNIRTKIEIQSGLLSRVQSRQEKVKRLLKGDKN